jgi:mRNA interferase MazF
VIRQGDVRWADLPDPVGSSAAYRRPVIVVQCDDFNRSRLGTVLCVPLTSELRWAEAAGNVLLQTSSTGLSKPSVAQAHLLLAIDRSFLDESRVGRLEDEELALLFSAIDQVLGR